MAPTTPRNYGAGVVTLEDEPVDAEQHEHVRDGGIADDFQQPGAPVGLDPFVYETGRVQFEAAPIDFDFPAVQLLEQVREVVGHQIDDVHLQGIQGTQAFRRANRVLGPVGVPAPQFRQTADVGDSVVDGLAFGGRRRRRDQVRGFGGAVFGVVGCGLFGIGVIRVIAIRFFVFISGSVRVLVRFVLALRFICRVGWRCRRGRADGHRSGRAEIGRRRHCSDVACVEDIGPRACRARALGPYVGGHRHRRGENALDDLAHGCIQSTGGIHLQHDERCIGFLGHLDAARNEVGRGRPDCALDLQQCHCSAAGGRFAAGRFVLILVRFGAVRRLVIEHVGDTLIAGFGYNGIFRRDRLRFDSFGLRFSFLRVQPDPEPRQEEQHRQYAPEPGAWACEMRAVAGHGDMIPALFGPN